MYPKRRQKIFIKIASQQSSGVFKDCQQYVLSLFSDSSKFRLQIRIGKKHPSSSVNDWILSFSRGGP